MVQAKRAACTRAPQQRHMENRAGRERDREGEGEKGLRDWCPRGLSDHSKNYLYEQLKGMEGF